MADLLLLLQTDSRAIQAGGRNP